MDYVYLEGGIGNQMFQYALYVALKEKGHKVKLDSSTLFKYLYKMHRCNIYDAFVLDDDVRTLAVKWQMKTQKLPYLHSHGILRRTLWKAIGIYKDATDERFDASLWDVSHGYFEGLWQSEKFFDFCRDKVRDAFCLRMPLPENNIPYLTQIQNAECPIAVHVRLGDYLSSGWAGYIGGICSKEYYAQAVATMTERYPNATFFVFSNEIQKALEMIDGVKCVAVNVNNEMSGWADLYLMSQCKHNIIANSSFSWWGAWLNDNPQKMVIAPARWTCKDNKPDICPDKWIRI